MPKLARIAPRSPETVSAHAQYAIASRWHPPGSAPVLEAQRRYRFHRLCDEAIAAVGTEPRLTAEEIAAVIELLTDGARGGQ